MMRANENPTLYVVQPVLASYRRELLLTLGSQYRVVFLSDRSLEGNAGFNNIDLPPTINRVHAPIRPFIGGKVFYQSRVLTRPYHHGDLIITFGNPRFVSFWLLLILGRLKGARVFVHGQGNFAYPDAGRLRVWMYRAICALGHKYICYNDYVHSEMIRIGCSDQKLAIAQNSLPVDVTVAPESKDFSVSGILFVGRLREGSSLDVAVQASAQLRQYDPNVRLHVVGGGDDEARCRSSFSSLEWVVFHGPVFDQQKIAEISRQCKVGCYPGSAGLSIVHYFALSLPVVVHSQIHQHMGPEPAYVRDGQNGFQFALLGDTVSALYGALLRAWQTEPHLLAAIGATAFETYRALATPTLGERFVAILKGDSSSMTGDT